MPAVVEVLIPIIRKIPGTRLVYSHLTPLQNYLTSKKYDYYANLKPANYYDELGKWYQSATGRFLNLENPRTFDEKSSG